jgi:hypothetical protein
MSSMKPISDLTKAEKVAIVSDYDLSNTQTMEHVCNVLEVQQDELEAAVGLTADGTFAPAELDTTPYQSLFDSTLLTAASAATAVAEPAQTGGIGNPTTSKPATATKAKKPHKRPGRQGVKIVQAFGKVPEGVENAISADDFAKTNNVSIAVLRQAKRFDPTFLTAGKVHVKQNKETRQLQIWREVLDSAEVDGEAVAAA